MVALLVVVFFITAVVINSILQRSQSADEKLTQPANLVTSPKLPFPLGYFFSSSHSWLNLMPSGKLKLGLDELIQKFMGDLSQINLKKPGDEVVRGENMAVLKKDNKEIFISSPIAGRIVETNYELEHSPVLLSDNPYEKGWLYTIKPYSLAEDLKRMKVSEQAASWFSNEMNRFRDFIRMNLPQPAPAGITLTDGGIVIDGLAEFVNQETISEFENQFLQLEPER